MPLVQANGLRFMFGRAGRGPRLLFLGGTGWDLRRTPGPLASVLIEHCDVLHFDQRGMGRSDKPPGPYTMLDYAEDAIAVMQAIGWSRANVAGYSFGGMVAQEMAIRWSDRIESLILAGTTAGGAGGASYPIHELLNLGPYERARRGLEIADMAFDADWQRRNGPAARRRIEARLRRQSQFALEPGAREGLCAQLAARSGHDTFDRLQRISAPTLVLAGSRDGQAPLRAQRRMAERIDGARFKVLEGGHDFVLEGDAVYREIVGHVSTAAGQ